MKRLAILLGHMRFKVVKFVAQVLFISVRIAFEAVAVLVMSATC
jgi:hypothetical protein